MDLAILKKKISTYKTTTGKLTRVPDELAYEILKSWEQWTGRAKNLQREGFFPADDFKEIKIDSASGQVLELTPCSGVEVVWDNGKIIRFSQVDLLLDFLKKAA